MKKEWEIYRDTGMLGAYDKDSAVLRHAEQGGVSTIFRDTRYKIEDHCFIRERDMLIQGKHFQITSVFPDGGATPTEKMLSYIDAELEKEAHSA